MRHKSMKKRDFGFFEKLLPVLLSTGIVFGLVLCSGQFMELLRAKEGINQVARAFLLKMETTGYLKSEELAELVTELEEYGLADISLEGTSKSPVPYGTPIYLKITGNLQKEVFFAVPLLSEARKRMDIPIEISLISTAKH